MQNKIFQCDAISKKDMEEIKDFTVSQSTGYGLLSYLQCVALQDESDHLARTYIVRDYKTNEIVGYFSLKAGSVTSFPKIRGIADFFARGFDSVPGIELSNFAINSSYKELHTEIDEIGMIVFQDFIIPICCKTSKVIGARLIYLFALPYLPLIKYYQDKLCFSRLGIISEMKTHRKIKPRYDRHCIFMYRLIE